MVTVQMSHRHRADRIRVQSLGFQRYQAGGPAVDEQYLLVGGKVDARLRAPAAAEGITAAHEPDPHDIILDHPGQTCCTR
jgi:hypothetical protein